MSYYDCWILLLGALHVPCFAMQCTHDSVGRLLHVRVLGSLWCKTWRSDNTTKQLQDSNSFCALFRHVSTVSSCFNMFCTRLLRAQSHRTELNHSSTCIMFSLQGQSCSWNCMYDSTYRGARLWVGELIADDTPKRKFGKPRETSEIQDISPSKTKRSSDVKCMFDKWRQSLCRCQKIKEVWNPRNPPESPVEVLDSLDSLDWRFNAWSTFARFMCSVMLSPVKGYKNYLERQAETKRDFLCMKFIYVYVVQGCNDCDSYFLPLRWSTSLGVGSGFAQRDSLERSLDQPICCFANITGTGRNRYRPNRRVKRLNCETGRAVPRPAPVIASACLGIVVGAVAVLARRRSRCLARSRCFLSGFIMFFFFLEHRSWNDNGMIMEWSW